MGTLTDKVFRVKKQVNENKKGTIEKIGVAIYGLHKGWGRGGCDSVPPPSISLVP